MALTILDRPSAGGQLGASLGTGLQMLAQNKLQQMQQRNQQQQTARGLSALPGFTPEMAESLSALDPQVLNQVVKSQLAAPGEQAYAQALSQLLGGGEQQPGQQIAGKEGAGMLLPKGLNAKQATELAKLGLDVQKNKRKEEAERRREIDKETLPAYQEITREAKVASNNDKRLDKLEKLALKGNLGSPVKNALIDTVSHGIFGFGINLNNLKTADAQEFEKISSEFVKDAKEIFGNRITDADLKAFMKTVPTLSNSREGMLKIINNLKVANAAAKVKKTIADQIIQENNGIRPANFENLVEERANPELDKLADQFEVSKVRAEILGSPKLGSIAQGAGLIY